MIMHNQQSKFCVTRNTAVIKTKEYGSFKNSFPPSVQPAKMLRPLCLFDLTECMQRCGDLFFWKANHFVFSET